jgi:Domain of unknown function (DUF3303)
VKRGARSFASSSEIRDFFTGTCGGCELSFGFVEFQLADFVVSLPGRRCNTLVFLGSHGAKGETSKGGHGMKVMVAWRTRAGSHEPAVEQFLKTGAQGNQDRGALACAGFDSWLAPAGGGGMTSIAEHVAEWANATNLEVHPVNEGAAAASRVSGR